jgi:predicted nucleic acid-binding protein
MTVLPPVSVPGAAGGAVESSLGANDLVVDAGVAIKWYVPEIHEAEAKRLLSPTSTLHVPELFFPEFGSIVWKKARLLKVPELTEEEGRDILRLLLAVDLEVHSMAPLLESAYKIAVGPERATVYDTCYLALALVLGCRLVTADRAFYDALKGGPHGAHLLWVADPI